MKCIKIIASITFILVSLQGLAQTYTCEQLVSKQEKNGVTFMGSTKDLVFRDVSGKEHVTITCNQDEFDISVIAHVFTNDENRDELNNQISESMNVTFRDKSTYKFGDNRKMNKFGIYSLNFRIGEYSVDDALESQMFKEIESVQLWRIGLFKIEIPFTEEQSKILAQTLKCMFNSLSLKSRFPALDEKYGFKDIKLEIAEADFLTSYKGEKITLPTPEITAYKLTDPKYYAVGDCKLNEAAAYFYQGRLMSIRLIADGQINKDCLFETVKGLFGQPAYATASSTNEKAVFDWAGKKAYARYTNANRGTFIMYCSSILKSWQGFDAKRKESINKNNTKDF